MAIKNLTDHKNNPAAGLRRLAIVKKGAMDGNRPVDLDHFRLKWADDEAEEADPDIELVRIAFYELYGVEPTRLENAFILTDDPDNAFFMEEWLKAGGGGKLIRRCDGETQVNHYDFNKKVMLYNPIPCIQGQEEGCQCRAVGRLSFILRDIVQRTGVLGYFQLQLGGKHEIANISAHLSNIKRMVNVPLFMVPFTIFRQDQAVNVPGFIKRVDKSLVHVQANLQALNSAIQIGYGDDHPLELEAGELPLDVTDVIEGEIAGKGVDFSRLSTKRPASLLEGTGDEVDPAIFKRPFVNMDQLGAWLRYEAAHSGENVELIDAGKAANIGRELSILFRNEAIRAYFLKMTFGLVPDKEGSISKYMQNREFAAIKKWKNLAHVAANILQEEIEMIIRSYQAEVGEAVNE